MDLPASGRTGTSHENAKSRDRSGPAPLEAQGSSEAWSKGGGTILFHSKWWETDLQKQPQMGMLIGLGVECMPVFPVPTAPRMGDMCQGRRLGQEMVQGVLSRRKIP